MVDFMFMVIMIIIIALAIYVNHYISKSFYDIAVKKGHNERKYYWLSFLLGLVGYLLVIALPDLKARPVNNDTPKVYTVENETKNKTNATETKTEDIKEQSNLLDIFKNDIK